MNGFRALGGCLVLGILAACGGGGSAGGGGGDRPTDPNTRRPTGPGTISGVAHDGPISGATINVYEWNGQKGQLIASTTTDSTGQYALRLSVSRQSLLIESVGGVYIEEATERTVIIPAGQALFAVLNYDPGQTLISNLTYYSTLAVGLAENLVKQGSPADEAVTNANTRIAGLLGLDMSQTPAVVNNRQGLTSEAMASVEFGFATAAISSLIRSVDSVLKSAPDASINSIGFIQAAFDDIRADGLLDGRGVRGLITLGKLGVTPDTYRRQLALSILQTAANPTANRLQINPSQLVRVALQLNSSTDPIFANAPVIPIDTDRPNIVDMSIRDGDVLFGRESRFAFSIQSLSELSSVQLLLNDAVVLSAPDPKALTASLDTTRFPDGEFDLTLVATDASGASGRKTVKIMIINTTATVVSNTLKENQFYNGAFDAQFALNDPNGISAVQYMVDGVVQQTQDPNAFFFDTTKIADGPHTVTVQVTAQVTNDLPGAVTTKAIPINIDNTPPEVTFSLADNALLRDSSLALTISATDAVFNAPRLPNVRDPGAFLLDGKANPQPPTGSSSSAANAVSFTQSFESIPEGPHTFSFKVSDAINSTFVSRRFTFDVTPPVNIVTSPRSCATVQTTVNGTTTATSRNCDATLSGIVTFTGSVRDAFSPVTQAQLWVQIISSNGNDGLPSSRFDLALAPDGSFSIDIDTRRLATNDGLIDPLFFGLISMDAAGNSSSDTVATPAGPGVITRSILVIN